MINRVTQHVYGTWGLITLLYPNCQGYLFPCYLHRLTLIARFFLASCFTPGRYRNFSIWKPSSFIATER